VPAVAISIPRRCHATSATFRLGPVPTPYPPPNSSGMNTYEKQGEGGTPSRTFLGSLFLALTDFCAGCPFLRSFLPRAIFARVLFPSLFLAPSDFCEGCPSGTLFCRARQLISLLFNAFRTLCRNTRGVPPSEKRYPWTHASRTNWPCSAASHD